VTDVEPAETGPGQAGAADAPHEHTHVIIPAGHHRGESMTFGQRVWYRVLWWVVQIVARGAFRVRVSGKENLPTTGAFIVSPIHRSNLDTPLLGVITRRRMRYMGKETLWKSKFGAWFLSGAGGFPVERGTADRAALRACLEVVERGEPLVMFPEGTRQHGPVTQHFFDGPAYVACRAQVPIVPIGIGGSERAMPKGKKIPRPTRMTIVIGEPIQPPAPEANGRVPRRAVQGLTQQLQVVVQDLFDEAQVLAGTPNPPRD
jgi:1-acyl-sn-glycerol-3-phosphate acyltransferase